MKLVGYSDRLSYRPGEEARFCVSAQSDYDVEIIRVAHGHSVADGGIRKSHVADLGRWPTQRQVTEIGSYARVHDGSGALLQPRLTLSAFVWSTLLAGEQAVMSWSDTAGQGYHLLLSDGRPQLRLEAETPFELELPTRLTPRVWHLLVATLDLNSGMGTITLLARSVWLSGTPLTTSAQDLPGGPGHGPGTFLIGAMRGAAEQAVRNCFNGKIARPAVHAAILDAGELSALSAGTPAAEIRPSDLASTWDFAPRRDQRDIPDRGPRLMHAEVVNAPTRAVTGPFWTGDYLDWRLAPGEYDALHFHCDDLEDSRWTVSFRWELPAGLASGVYAARLRAEDAEDHIPFAVVSSDRANRAPVAVILPTLTYQAYANFRRQGAVPEDFAFGDWRPQPDPRDQYVTDHPDLGLSVYDRHLDGSGCCYSSIRRPIPSLRVDYHSIRVDGPRHLSADMLLIEWLDRCGYRFDVLTDHDVHHDPSLLCGYNVVLTGTHPEYQTATTLDALQDHLTRGGNLMYLGGNGFYWVTSIDPLTPYMIEVRRGVNGTRAWTSEPGESHHSSTGEPGALWRQRGRAPNRLVGIGFASEGWDGRSPGYRRLHPDGEPEYVFAGVQGEVFGEFGSVMGGAAGDEIDRVDDQLGTPSAVLRLATSTGHSDAYQLVVEDVEVMHSRTTGTTNPDVRSDIVLLEAPGAGRVFSVGSISWCASLSHNDYCNDVARITANVLDEFGGSNGPTRRGEGNVPSQ